MLRSTSKAIEFHRKKIHISILFLLFQATILCVDGGNDDDDVSKINSSNENRNDYPLHQSVFEKNLQKFSELLKTNDVNLKDKHGNTALHLAVMLGLKQFIDPLLEHDTKIKAKNVNGWTALDEAISYGDRDTISSLLKKKKQQQQEKMKHRKPHLIKSIKDMGDFYMELKYDFQSWIPFVTGFLQLPSDTVKIHKCGSSIRLDTTLVDFSERGDISFIFRGDDSLSDSLTMVNNNNRFNQKIQLKAPDYGIEVQVTNLMSNDIVATRVARENIKFIRAQNGYIYRSDRRQLISSQYDCELFYVNGLEFKFLKRREHLSIDDLNKNRARVNSLKNGQLKQNDDLNRRKSLPPPNEHNVTWTDYINAKSGEYPTLGRQIVYKETTKTYKATVAMCKEFPLTVEMLLNILEVFAPVKHLIQLREFIELELPSGFPVKLDIPLYPTITAKITFQNFEYRNNISMDLFKIPTDYKNGTVIRIPLL